MDGLSARARMAARQWRRAAIGEADAASRRDGDETTVVKIHSGNGSTMKWIAALLPASTRL